MHQRRGRRNGVDIDRARIRLTHLQGLRREVGIGTREAFGCDDLDALGLGDVLHCDPAALAEGVLEAKECDLLDAALDHVVDKSRHLKLVGARRLEYPVPVFHGLDHALAERQRDVGDLGLRHGLQNRHRGRRRGAADHHMRAILGDQLADVIDSLGRVRSVIIGDELDGERQAGVVSKLLLQQFQRILFRQAERRSRAGHRHHRTDAQFGLVGGVRRDRDCQCRRGRSD